MRKKEPLLWIPIYVDKWLYGSTREELEADECSVWTDFLCLGAKDSGYIRANEGFPYSEARIAGLLGRTEELIHRTIEKCLRTHTDNPDEKPKLTRLPDGTLYITNWEEYKLSPRHARRFAQGESSGVAAKEDTMAENPATREKKRKEKERIQSIGVPQPGPGPLSGIPATLEIEAIRAKWNKFADGHGLAKIHSIPKGSARERALLARIRDGLDFEKVLEAIHHQPFLYGENDRGWLLNFDWILKPANLAKILEGAYFREVRGAARDRQPEDPRVGGRR